MALYKEHGVNPFLSIILLIVQLPILITLYRIILSGLGAGGIGAGLYAFIPAPNTINALFLGILDLKQRSIILVLLAAIAQYFQARLAIYRSPNAGPPSPAEKMARQMAFIGPVITIVIFYNLPAGVGLYWLISSLFSISPTDYRKQATTREIRGVKCHPDKRRDREIWLPCRTRDRILIFRRKLEIVSSMDVWETFIKKHRRADGIPRLSS